MKKISENHDKCALSFLFYLFFVIPCFITYDNDLIFNLIALSTGMFEGRHMLERASIGVP